MAETLDIALAGERLRGDELQASVAHLHALADGLDDDIASDMRIDALQEIGRAQAQLHDAAATLAALQVGLRAGGAKVTAAHVDAAVRAAAEAIPRIADAVVKRATIGVLLDFLAAVGTGDGDRMVRAAAALEEAMRPPSARGRRPSPSSRRSPPPAPAHRRRRPPAR